MIFCGWMESQKLNTKKLKCYTLGPKSQKFLNTENTRYTVFASALFNLHLYKWNNSYIQDLVVSWISRTLCCLFDWKKGGCTYYPLATELEGIYRITGIFCGCLIFAEFCGSIEIAEIENHKIFKSRYSDEIVKINLNIQWQLFWWIFNTFNTVGDRWKPLSFKMSILRYVKL